MADGTLIEWADATVNAINGCTRVSPGCGGPGELGGCYAERLAATRLRNHPSRAGLAEMTSKGPRWTGVVKLHERALLEPLTWRRSRRIFWNAHGDLFHSSVPDEWIDRVMAVCALTPQHTHLILTKRPERMRAYAEDSRARGRVARAILDMLIAGTIPHREPWPVQTVGDVDDPDDVTVEWPLANVWLGTSVEDQQRADERIPYLLATPAARRFLSCEPLLGPVDLTNITGAEKSQEYGSPVHGWSVIWRDNAIGRNWLDWVIVGGESGPNARPMHPDWARSLRDQCAAADVPFFFKQWGAWAPLRDAAPVQPGSPAAAAWPDGTVRAGIGVGAGMGPGIALFHGDKKITGRLLDGVTHDGMPG